ncbi:MAG: type II secretion system inner membrane protein GspF [Bdellovibrionales bacterium]|nr:type II secretion system inner membrane protein GspF [Bdellovibrionales bacterium]
MAVFEYTALNASGRKVKGVVDAESLRAARSKLKAQGVFPTTLDEAKTRTLGRSAKGTSIFGERRVGSAQLGIATRQLATLVGAGMPLVEALKALGDQLDQPRLKAVIADIASRVNEGSTFADAIRAHPRVFPKLYPNMIASAEASGTLEVVLDRLAELLESSATLRRQVFAALAYPILMLFLCLGVVILLLTYVVPQITEIFEEHGGVLPLPTRIVIALSDFIQSQWIPCVVLCGLIVVAITRYYQTEAGRERIDGFRLKFPVFGALTTKAAAARFSRTLGTMLSSGVELLTALTIVKNIIGNVVIENAIADAREGVREGKNLADELDKSGVFPRLLVQMTAIGEKTGELESMLLRAARAYESEVNTVISALTAVLNPILILLLAGIVGMILVSVLLPMLEMTSLAG